MAEIINFRRAKKAKARADKDREAEQNRITHGRTKAEKAEAKRLQDEAQRNVDQHRLDNETKDD